MKLQLSRPLAFFDLEATGLNVSTDRIVQISILKLHPDGHTESHTFLVNPTIPIPPESTAVHHITDEDVKDAPTFKIVGRRVAEIINGCDLAGYNSNKFDIPMLSEEFYRHDIDIDLHRCKFVDVQNIFHKMEQRTLSAAYLFYCNKDLTAAHSADGDTLATYEVLMAQLDKYPDLGKTVDKLSEFSTMHKTADFAGRIGYDDKGNEIFNFGKHKGKLVENVFNTVDPTYYSWMMQGDFPQDTKRVITAIKLRRK
jgi:DNA polymerase-3 subunit epsilon